MSLELRSIHKTFGSFTALHELSLAIEPGEFVSMLGPSGCGKTTALRAIAGFELPDEGSVLLEGEDITELPTAKRNLGIVFQAYSLFPNMSAASNVEYGLKVRKIDKEQRSKRVGEMLDLVGLTAQADKYPHQMSGGQQQRVALARALAIEPKVLLLDEPLSALDAKVRASLRDQIRLIQTELGITTVFVTHDQAEALTVSDRVAVLSEGRLEQFDRPDVIYSDPKTRFVAEFVGENNRIDATISSRAGTVGVSLAGQFLPVTRAKDHAEGDAVRVLVRPEDTTIVPFADGRDGLRATLAHQQFRGATTRLVAILDTRVSDAPTIVMSDVEGAYRSSMSDGDKTLVSFNPDSALIVARDW